MITKNTLKLAIAIALSITTINADKIISSSKGICRPHYARKECKNDLWKEVLKCESKLFAKYIKELRGAKNGTK